MAELVDATLDGVTYIAQSYISWSEGLVKNREYVVQVQVLLLAQVVREDEDKCFKVTIEGGESHSLFILIAVKPTCL